MDEEFKVRITIVCPLSVASLVSDVLKGTASTLDVKSEPAVNDQVVKRRRQSTMRYHGGHKDKGIVANDYIMDLLHAKPGGLMTTKEMKSKAIIKNFAPGTLVSAANRLVLSGKLIRPRKGTYKLP